MIPDDAGGPKSHHKGPYKRRLRGVKRGGNRTTEALGGGIWSQKPRTVGGVCKLQMKKIASPPSLWRECGHGLKRPATHPVWRAPTEIKNSLISVAQRCLKICFCTLTVI